MDRWYSVSGTALGAFADVSNSQNGKTCQNRKKMLGASLGVLNCIKFIIIKMSNECRQRVAFKIETALMPGVYEEVERAVLACPYVKRVTAWKSETTFYTLWLLEAGSTMPMPRCILLRGKLRSSLEALGAFEALIRIEQRTIDAHVEEFLRSPATSVLCGA